jgi:hypothetical protein
VHDNVLAHQALATQKILGVPGLPTSWSPTLFSRSGPVRRPPGLWNEERIERSPFFIWHGGHYCRRDLVGWVTFWNFFWVTYKSNGLRSVLSFAGSMLNKSWVRSL